MLSNCRISPCLGVASLLLTAQLCAQLVKEIHIDSQPPGATIEMLVGARRQPVGQTPLTYTAEFHSEISVLRFSASMPGFEPREFEVAGKDDHVLIQLQERSFTTPPAELTDPALQKMQEQMVTAVEKIMRDALKQQSPFQLDLAKKIELHRIDGNAYLVVPLTVEQVPADYRQVGAGNAQAFLAELWNQLGDNFALALVAAARKVNGISGIVLDVDYSHMQSNFSVGFHQQSTVEMVCQTGTKMQAVYDSCASRRPVQYYNAQTHDWYTSGTECVGGTVYRPVVDYCAYKIPVTRTKFVADPTVSFAQTKSKAKYIGTLEVFGTATHAKDVYSRISTILTDSKGRILVRQGDLPPSLLPLNPDTAPATQQ